MEIEQDIPLKTEIESFSEPIRQQGYAAPYLASHGSTTSSFAAVQPSFGGLSTIQEDNDGEEVCTVAAAGLSPSFFARFFDKRKSSPAILGVPLDVPPSDAPLKAHLSQHRNSIEAAMLLATFNRVPTVTKEETDDLEEPVTLERSLPTWQDDLSLISKPNNSVRRHSYDLNLDWPTLSELHALSPSIFTSVFNQEQKPVKPSTGPEKSMSLPSLSQSTGNVFSYHGPNTTSSHPEAPAIQRLTWTHDSYPPDTPLPSSAYPPAYPPLNPLPPLTDPPGFAPHLKQDPANNFLPPPVYADQPLPHAHPFAMPPQPYYFPHPGSKLPLPNQPVAMPPPGHPLHGHPHPFMYPAMPAHPMHPPPAITQPIRKRKRALKEVEEIVEHGHADFPDMCPRDIELSKTDPEARPRRQKLRFEGDMYTPKWVRFNGQSKEGLCDTCQPGRWLQLKNSAYWYHKQFYHGISSVSGAEFVQPMETRWVDQDLVEGLCHQCHQWVAVSNVKRKNSVLWFRHAHKCHVYHKPKNPSPRQL
ncbi:hypothetical protein DM01DRAFT_1403515 [Hesseltinella vesiculosa]|uniref:Transcription regulator Rua1 C-terminal domain-containing protein n=1 Tax=Hesseltinella vesiculosa TaxID=101127 RepID=A0A1X2GYI4_9FUNG|nr:hypothetical protein DM01DRAFT_1403515 [Hesseltinella vesiculosa]